jgi:hypothetical protein
MGAALGSKNVEIFGGIALPNGVQFRVSATDPVNGTSGTFAKSAGFGSILISAASGAQFMNTGTMASPVWTPVAGAGVGNMQFAVLDMTNAQVKNCRATPVTIVAAPGVGKTVVPIDVVGYLKYGGTNAFTAAVGDNMSIKRKDGTGAILASGMIQAMLQNTGSAMSEWVWPTTSTNELKAVVDNMPLVVHNQTAAEIAGNAAADNLVRIVVAYQILATPTAW